MRKMMVVLLFSLFYINSYASYTASNILTNSVTNFSETMFFSNNVMANPAYSQKTTFIIKFDPITYGSYILVSNLNITTNTNYNNYFLFCKENPRLYDYVKRILELCMLSVSEDACAYYYFNLYYENSTGTNKILGIEISNRILYDNG